MEYAKTLLCIFVFFFLRKTILFHREETTICMVSSQKDIISNCVYPTHPLTMKKNYPNVHMLPDPCIIDINGITIGATSTDVVKHLLEEELSVYVNFFIL